MNYGSMFRLILIALAFIVIAKTIRLFARAFPDKSYQGSPFLMVLADAIEFLVWIALLFGAIVAYSTIGW